MGLVTAVLDSIYYQHLVNQGYPTLDDQKRRHWRTAVTVLVVGILTTLVVALYDIPFLALSFGVVAGVNFGLITYFVNGNNLRDDIRTVASLDWSWSGVQSEQSWPLQRSAETIGAADGWQTYAALAVPPPDAQGAQLELLNLDSTGSVYVDNAVMAAISAPTP